MGRRDEYVTVTCTLAARTDKAVLLHANSDSGGGGWVPRSCLHFMSDKSVSNASIGDELELRVMEWVVEEKGLM